MGMEGFEGMVSGTICGMMDAPIIDEKVNSCLKEIKLALLQNDVHSDLVRDLEINVKNRIEDNCSSAPYDKQIALQSTFDDLCKILDPGMLPLEPSLSLVADRFVTQKHIVMFVGLQGSGKTRACTQFANYHKKQKGFHPAVVSVGTSDFDQLMQGTISPPIPLYLSSLRSGPVAKTALRAVHWFQKRTKDLVIIDTSECHTQVSSLLEEISQVYEATKPDLVILVVDSAIGQAAFQQVLSFKQAVQVGGVIMTNVNYGRQDGEAFAAIAATQTPIMFIGRGQCLEEFQVFNIKPFLCRLLGRQEILGFKEDAIVDLDIWTNYTLRVYHMFIHISQKFWGMSETVSRNLLILNSMENEELDGRLQNLLTCSFIWRIASTSGFSVGEVLLLIEDYKNVVAVFETFDRTRFSVCEYFDKIFPGVIMDNPARRKKIEAGEDINKPTKEELMKIAESVYPKPGDSKRVSVFKCQNKRVYEQYMDENGTLRRKIGPTDNAAVDKRLRKDMEEEALVLAALYGKGKPLEAKGKVGEGSGAVVKLEELNILCHLLGFYRMMTQLSS